MKKKWIWLYVFLLASMSALTACGGGDSAGDNSFLTIATGGQSGVYYPLGAAIGKLYEQELGAKSSIQATGASVENINLLDQDRAEMAIIMGDAATQAYEGLEPFEDKVESFQAVASLYPNFVQIVTTEESGIETMMDLKGKRVAIGAPNSGVELNARAILKAHGLSYEDFNEDFLSYAEAVDGMKNGTVDAAFVTSGLPNPSVTDLGTTKKVKVIPIEGKGMNKLQELYPYYSEATIPADTYGNKEEIQTASIMNLLVVQSDLDEETVYQWTQTLFENLEPIHRSHNAAKEIDFDTARENVPIPFHPGAEKYYEEAGQ
ncbi:TAXI family TRAP transporter solute-binding subunit [Desmospora profundinema]|uniref:TRAP transporter TAXI family solute receptor n=1 Tax=Desmospora profundinema TaxID=1571184 RepID=A0ABU1IKP2_9BACL|nr:TAXI family TRAP transporter solute-binding subunit [Desmospora profundinema]MDR6224380.1 TRAP transporter TAXI family solute receptor [Desmospora profundinema]